MTIKYGQSKITHHASNRSLLKSLEAPNENFVVTESSARADACNLLGLMYDMARDGTMSFFLLQHDDKVDIYVIDEKGRLFVQRRPSLTADLTASQFGQFFRYIPQHTPTVVLDGLDHLRMFQSWALFKALETAPLQSTEINFDTQIPLKVFVDSKSRDAQIMTIMAEDDEFSTSQLGRELFDVIALSIPAKRNAQTNYPLYINNQEFSHDYQAARNIAALKTNPILNLKERIEYKLSKAID